MKIYYDDIFISEFHTNRSMTVLEMLDQLNFDYEEFKEKHDIENIDYNLFKVEVKR